MIRTFVIPESDKISISVPDDYIGKVLEVIAFAKDEAEHDRKGKKKTSFTILHTTVSDFKFNRDEANER